MSARDDARRETERAFLGGLLHAPPERVVEVDRIVRPEDFEDNRLRTIYTELLARSERGQPTDDLVSLAGALQRIRGIRSLLAELAEEEPTSSHALHHAQEVAAYAKLDRLSAMGKNLARDAEQAPPDAADELHARAEQELSALRESARRRGASGALAPRPLDLDDALEPELADACRRVGVWLQIAPEAVVTCLLAYASAAIGNTRRVHARGLRVALSLQFLTALPSGSGKSAIRAYFRRATKGIEREVLERRKIAAREMEEHENDLAAWTRAKRNASEKARTAAGERPQPPAPKPDGGPRVSFVVSEANLEGVISTLEDSPRGFLWATDEAHEIVGMLGAYGNGRRGLDAARLRRLTEGQPVEAHRGRSNADPVRRVPLPFLSLDADVQSGILAGLFTAEDRISGLTARILIHSPPPMQGQRTYRKAPPEPGERVLSLFCRRLGALWSEPLVLDEDGVPKPRPLRLEAAAEDRWAEELERLEDRYERVSEELEGLLGHLRGRLLRLAGVLALLRRPGAEHVEVEDMERAITFGRYFLAHATRPLGRISPAERERSGLIGWIRRRGGSTTVRDLGKGPRRFRGTDGARRAEAELEALVASGVGRWEHGRPNSTGGRPARRLVLLAADDGHPDQGHDSFIGDRGRGGGGTTPRGDGESGGFAAAAGVASPVGAPDADPTDITEGDDHDPGNLGESLVALGEAAEPVPDGWEAL